MSELTIVTGAPGAGKTTTVEQLLAIGSDFVVFDMDWLADTAGTLAKRSIYSDETTWAPYGALWSEVLRSVCRNDRRAIFFSPNTPEDLESSGSWGWCVNPRWLLLDCEDEVRLSRLEQRQGWTMDRKNEALADALELRQLGLPVLDSGSEAPGKIAERVLEFAADGCTTPGAV